MDSYNLSRYNWVIYENGHNYIFNAISGSIIKISEKLAYSINNKTFNANTCNNKLLELLVNNNIIYSKKNDEINLLKYKYLKAKYDDSFLSIVMLPSLKCNLQCHYCYEKFKKKSLNKDNLNSLKKFFSTQAQQKRYITLRWSGGEIMTVWQHIYELSKHIQSECKKYHCGFSASAISNGTLLTAEVVDQMAYCEIKSLQITLDGDRHTHNKTRFYLNKLGTFDDIIKNIEIASHKIKVIIRVNVDKNNINSMESLFRTLSLSNANKSKIQVSCKPVLCTLAQMPKHDTFAHKEFYNIELQLIQLAEQYQIPYAFHMGINSVQTRCAYASLQGYYITPDLKVFKCPAYVDIDDKVSRAIGKIMPNGELKINNINEYMNSFNYSPFSNNECIECKALPICHGKCPIIWELNKQSQDEGCIPEKHTIEAKIRYAIRNQQQMNAYFNSGLS